MSKQVTVIVEGKEYVVTVGDLSARPVVASVGDTTYQVEVPAAPSAPVTSGFPAPVATPAVAKKAAPVATGSAVTAPMPGDIDEVLVKVGDVVEAAQPVIVLEAMKMKNQIRANVAGKVASIEVSSGDHVDYGAVLVTFE